MKTIVIVSIHFEASPQAVPLGAAMLAANIKATGGLKGKVASLIKEFYASDSPIDCAEIIEAALPDYVGFSITLWNRSLALEIAARLKRRRPGIVILAGGPEATADAPGILACGYFDFVLRGEAEKSLPAVLACLLKGGTAVAAALAGKAITGLVLPESGTAGAPAYAEDLDSLVSPYLDGTLDTTVYDGLLWELSRGCPFGCHFCYEARGKRGVRTFSLRRLKKELDLFRRAGVSQVYVLDPTFNVNGKRAKDILKIIRRKAPSIHFTFEVRSECLDEEQAALFSRIPCSVQIGLQSARPDVLARVGRIMDREDFYSKVLLLHEAGVVYGFDLIYGLPGDNLNGFFNTLDFALEMRPNHLDIFPLAVLPGTLLAEEAPEFNLRYLSSPPYTVLSTPTMGPDDLEEAAKIAEACELLYNKAGAVSWFYMVTEALSLKPAKLLTRFVSWLESNPFGKDFNTLWEDSPFWRLALNDCVKSFVKECFDRAGRSDQGLMAADIISYFQETAETRDLVFSFDPEALGAYLESGIDDIGELSMLVAKKS